MTERYVQPQRSRAGGGRTPRTQFSWAFGAGGLRHYQHVAEVSAAVLDPQRERAAAVYKQESELLAATFGAKEAFLGPWTGKKIADWTPAVREKEIQTLAKALKLETRAIAELERALAETAAALGAKGAGAE